MESAVPPSYAEATTRDSWNIVSQYIQSADLCAASLVSKRWHEIFAPCLWGNPASHFGTENDRVYVALTRFRRALPRVRLSVRQLTHTLHLPPALSEIYDGPHPEWLREVLEQLPNLQSLVVSQLPFFDHSALFALRQYSLTQTPKPLEDFPTFYLRLLIASQCSNTTSTSLAEAFLHWPSLVFLDLSDTLAARDHAVLSTLRFMSSLQILKLRHVQLRDEDVVVLADAIGIRVRSLDIRDNKITDTSVRALLATCFHSTNDVLATQMDMARQRTSAEEDWPSGVPRPDIHLLSEFRGEDIDERFVKRLTKGVVSRLPSEDLPPIGITHLYIANNFVSVEGIASLVKSGNLHVLDAGSIDTAKALGQPRARSSISRSFDYSMLLPGVEKLTPVLARFACKNLTYLRLNHALVTGIAPTKEDVTMAAELSSENPASRELDSVANERHELDATVPIYELPDSMPTPRHELPGDPIHVLISPAMGEAPTLTREEDSSWMEVQSSSIDGASLYAPEVVSTEGSLGEDDEPVVLTATGLGNMAQAVNGVSSPSSPLTHTSPFTQPPVPMDRPSGRDNPELEFKTIEEQRRQLRSHFSNIGRGLLPGELPALRTLVLTDVPCTVNDHHVVTALKKFIESCSEEAKLASLQASLEYPSLYVPGKPRSMHHNYRAQELFALRRIILEMAPLSSAAPSVADGPMSPLTPSPRTWTFPPNRSSTEDADTEAFWSAQENDFSFFGDEECGLPASEASLHFPMSTLSEKMVLLPESLQPGALPTLQQLERADVGIDLVQELAKFRKASKTAYEGAINAGQKYADGYWPGEVKIVRHQIGPVRKGSLDFYGNYFNKGVYH